MYLFVDQYGAFVARHQRRLRVLKEQQRLHEVPLLHLEQVIISGKGISISSDAVRACSDEGIPRGRREGRGVRSEWGKAAMRVFRSLLTSSPLSPCAE